MKKYLVVGLGNIGNEYQNTKHNVGFMFVDYFANKYKYKFDMHFKNGDYFSFLSGNSITYVAKPTTYMNLSGEFVYQFSNYYKIPIENILIIYDDMDLLFGQYKIKEKGSSGGQNGIKNIINLIHTENIKRIKIGIGKPQVKNNNSVINYVLSKFSNDQIKILNNMFDKLTDIINELSINDFNKIVSKFN